jgi:transcriptional regulator with XRE-family HTH domain
MCEIGKKMYNRRKELGLTLEEVGDAVGVGKSTVRRWENGMIKNMGRDKIAALARVLKMSPVEFVPGDEPNGISHEDMDILEVLHQDPKLRLLFDRARAMSERDKDKMLRISDIIKDELYGDG